MAVADVLLATKTAKSDELIQKRDYLEGETKKNLSGEADGDPK